MTQDNSSDTPPVSQPVMPPQVPPVSQQTSPAWLSNLQPPRKSIIGRVFTYLGGAILVGSVLLNVYLLFLVGAMSAGSFSEDVIRSGRDDQVVAVYGVTGIIDAQAAARFAAFYRSVKDDSNVKAVVIRVDSPGGGVAASDQIHQMVHALRHTHGKKVVVSMGGVAASGGYYISAPAEIIYAEPTTLTGSVGVISAMPILKDFLDKHGVNMMVVRSRQSQRWKAAFNYFEQPDEETYDQTQGHLNVIHKRFEQVVRDGRGDRLKTTQTSVSVKDFNGKDVIIQQTAPLNGQVYMADDALKIGLVDEIGYVNEAIDNAARLARLNKPKVVQYSHRRNLRERMGFSDVPAGIDMKVLDRYLSPRPMLLWQGR